MQTIKLKLNGKFQEEDLFMLINLLNLMQHTNIELSRFKNNQAFEKCLINKVENNQIPDD